VGEFAFWVGVTVIGGLILAGILTAIRWLRVEDNWERLRQRVCRHDWEPIQTNYGTPSARMVFVAPYSEQCRKCGAVR
jgi:uncharacterized membrane protein YciS (DUF1049 family)